MSHQPGNNNGVIETLDQTCLEFLRPAQVAMIDEALAAVGDFGEVHLIVENRRLRWVVTQRSADALKWQTGSLAGRGNRRHPAAPGDSHVRDE